MYKYIFRHQKLQILKITKIKLDQIYMFKLFFNLPLEIFDIKIYYFYFILDHINYIYIDNYIKLY